MAPVQEARFQVWSDCHVSLVDDNRGRRYRIGCLTRFFCPDEPAGYLRSSAAATTARPVLSQEDRTFVNQAAIGGMAEVERSKIGQKSENPEVKSYANRMVRDHSASSQQLTDASASVGIEVPKALDTEHQRMREKLQRLHGKAFDDEYIRNMVEDHNKAVRLFQKEEHSGRDARLRQLTPNTLPTLEEHQKWQSSCLTSCRGPQPDSSRAAIATDLTEVRISIFWKPQ